MLRKNTEWYNNFIPITNRTRSLYLQIGRKSKVSTCRQQKAAEQTSLKRNMAPINERPIETTEVIVKSIEKTIHSIVFLKTLIVPSQVCVKFATNVKKTWNG